MIALPISAQAEELKWSVSNSVDEYVLAKFVYENGYKIPEHRDGIRIRPHGSITIDLQCEAGQRICLSAWNENRDFSDDCIACARQHRTTTLHE